MSDTTNTESPTSAPQPPTPKPKVAMGKPVMSSYPAQPGSILDTTPEPQPFITSDARTAAGELELLGGYIREDKETGEQTRFNIAVMREMSGHEEDLMANTKMEFARRLNIILGNCLERLGDGKGNYITEKSELSRAVTKLTSADQTQMILFLRIISTEEGVSFRFKANCPQCGVEFFKNVNLGELKKRPMVNPMERLYDVSLDNGKNVRCKIMSIEDEVITEKARQSGQNILSAGLLARVREIDGQPAGFGEVKELRMRDRNRLRSEFERREGGVETSTPHICTACNTQFEVDIDITQRGFFFPSETSNA